MYFYLLKQEGIKFPDSEESMEDLHKDPLDREN